MTGSLAKQLAEDFAGRREQFNCRWRPMGTEFQRRVWNEIARVTFGGSRTRSGGAEKGPARASGLDPNSVRPR